MEEDIRGSEEHQQEPTHEGSVSDGRRSSEPPAAENALDGHDVVRQRAEENGAVLAGPGRRGVG